MDLSNKWKDNWKDITEEDVMHLAKQIETQPLSIVSGGILKRFEKIYAKFAGAKYAVSTNNGTSAIYSALWAACVRQGDEVLVCDYGFVAMAGAIASLKAIMVPVDMNPETLAIDSQDLKSKITSKSKAVLVHNPWGVPAELDTIRSVTELPIILDASHAHGALYKGKSLSSWADITCYSLGKDKLITGGELGCAVTDNIDFRDRMILLGHTNRTPYDLQTEIWNGNNIGLKFRPHPIALGIAMRQLKRFEEKKEKLIATCQKIEDIFSRYGFVPQKIYPNSQRVYWRIVFKVDQAKWNGISVPDIETSLKNTGLPIEPNHYWPLLQHQSPFLWEDNNVLVRNMECPQTISVSPNLITFPAPVDYSEEQFAMIEQCLIEVRKNLAVE